jgi:hypothetical protein
MAGNDAKPAEAAAKPSPNITGKTARIRLEKHMRPNSKHHRFAGKVFSSRIATNSTAHRDWGGRRRSRIHLNESSAGFSIKMFGPFGKMLKAES